MYTILKYEISFYTNKVRESTILGSFDDVAEETWKCILNKDCDLISVMVNFLCYPKGETSGIPKSAILFVLPPEKDDFKKFKKELEESIDGALETVEAKAEDEYKNHRFNIHLHICDYDWNKAFFINTVSCFRYFYLYFLYTRSEKEIQFRSCISVCTKRR